MVEPHLPISPPPCSRASASTRPRVHCMTNTVAQQYTANMLLAAGAVPSMTCRRRRSAPSSPAPMRFWSISAPSMPSADRRSRRRCGAAADERQALAARSGLHRALARRAPNSRATLVGRRPAVVRLNQAEFAALSGDDQAGDAPARFAKAHATHCRAHRPRRYRRRRRAARDHRQRRSADGAGHRHGLRRLGAGLRGACGRARSLARDHRGAVGVRRRRRSRGARMPAGPAASPSPSSTRCTISTARPCARI